MIECEDDIDSSPHGGNIQPPHQSFARVNANNPSGHQPAPCQQQSNESRPQIQVHFQPQLQTQSQNHPVQFNAHYHLQQQHLQQQRTQRQQQQLQQQLQQQQQELNFRQQILQTQQKLLMQQLSVQQRSQLPQQHPPHPMRPPFQSTSTILNSNERAALASTTAPTHAAISTKRSSSSATSSSSSSSSVDKELPSAVRMDASASAPDDGDDDDRGSDEGSDDDTDSTVSSSGDEEGADPGKRYDAFPDPLSLIDKKVNLDKVLHAKSIGDAVLLLCPNMPGLPCKARGRYQKRKDLTTEEKADILRARNRDNARRTRKRKKMYVTFIDKVLKALESELGSNAPHLNPPNPRPGLNPNLQPGPGPARNPCAAAMTAATAGAAAVAAGAMDVATGANAGMKMEMDAVVDTGMGTGTGMGMDMGIGTGISAGAVPVPSSSTEVDQRPPTTTTTTLMTTQYNDRSSSSSSGGGGTSTCDAGSEAVMLQSRLDSFRSFLELRLTRRCSRAHADAGEAGGGSWMHAWLGVCLQTALHNTVGGDSSWVAAEPNVHPSFAPSSSSSSLPGRVCQGVEAIEAQGEMTARHFDDLERAYRRQQVGLELDYEDEDDVALRVTSWFVQCTLHTADAILDAGGAKLSVSYDLAVVCDEPLAAPPLATLTTANVAQIGQHQPFGNPVAAAVGGNGPKGVTDAAVAAGHTNYPFEYDSSIESEDGDADAMDYYACFDALRESSERCSLRGSFVAELVPTALTASATAASASAAAAAQSTGRSTLFDGQEEPIENWIATMLTATAPDAGQRRISSCGSVSSISSAPRRALARVEAADMATMCDDHTHSDQACDHSRRPMAFATSHGTMAVHGHGVGPAVEPVPVPPGASFHAQDASCAAAQRGLEPHRLVWVSPTDGHASTILVVEDGSAPAGRGLHSLFRKRFNAIVDFATLPAEGGVRISRVTEYVEDCC